MDTYDDLFSKRNPDRKPDEVFLSDIARLSRTIFEAVKYISCSVSELSLNERGCRGVPLETFKDADASPFTLANLNRVHLTLGSNVMTATDQSGLSGFLRAARGLKSLSLRWEGFMCGDDYESYYAFRWVVGSIGCTQLVDLGLDGINLKSKDFVDFVLRHRLSLKKVNLDYMQLAQPVIGVI